MNEKVVALLHGLVGETIRSRKIFVKPFSKNSQMACLNRHYRSFSQTKISSVIESRHEKLLIAVQGFLGTERIQLNPEMLGALR